MSTERPQTLRELIEAHPEWADLPIVVFRFPGSFDWLGYATASVGVIIDADQEVLAFQPIRFDLPAV
jgi:hypothetical protein